MAMYVDSGGGGIISRIQPLMLVYSTYFIFEQIIVKRKKNIMYISLIGLFVIFGILSGSKSSFLLFLFCYYFLCIRYKRKIFNLKLLFIVFPLAILTASIGLVIRSEEGSLTEGFLVFLYRFLASGDVYYYALPYDTYNSIHINNPVSYLAAQFLIPARVMPLSSLEEGTGYQLYWTIYPESLNILSGPNSRIPFLSYVLFGNYGILFSLFAGVFSSCVIFLNKYFFSGNQLFYPFYIFCTTQLVFFIYDFASGIGKLFSIFVCFVILILFVYLANFLIVMLRTKVKV